MDSLRLPFAGRSRCTGNRVDEVWYFLEKAGVGLGDGRTYGPGYEKYVRLNFATSRDILNMTIDRIVAA